MFDGGKFVRRVLVAAEEGVPEVLDHTQDILAEFVGEGHPLGLGKLILEDLDGAGHNCPLSYVGTSSEPLLLDLQDHFRLCREEGGVDEEGCFAKPCPEALH